MPENSPNISQDKSVQPRRSHSQRVCLRALCIRLLPVRKSLRRVQSCSLRWRAKLRSWYRRHIKNTYTEQETQTERLWKQLITWPVVSTVVLAPIGIGVGVLSMTPPEFIIAKVCFLSSSVILLAKVVHWLVNAKTNRVERMVLTFIIFGAVGIALVESLHWVSNRQQLSASVSRLPTPQVQSSALTTPQPSQEIQPSLNPQVIEPLSVAFFYNNKGIEIHNLRKTEFFLYGSKLGNQQPVMEDVPRTVPTEPFHYYIEAASFEQEVVERVGADGQGRINYYIFVEDMSKRKFTITCELWVVVRNHQATIHTQNLGTQDGWLK